MKVLGSGLAALSAPSQGLGCMGLSSAYISNESQTEEDKIEFLRKAMALGVNFFDTSDIYGPFTNELLIGKAIKGYDRSKLTICTKFGVSFGPQGVKVRGDREYVREAVQASLKRLDVEYIDLYYIHRIDQTVPIEDTIEELATFVKAGKIRYLGLSEASPQTVRRAHAVHPITAYQLEWSLWSRDVEEDLIPVLRELKIGIVAYSPLGRGFLAGLFKKPEDLQKGDWRATNPRFSEDSMKKNVPLLEKLEKIALEKGVTPAQVALAWVQNQGDDVVTIPGTTKLKNLEDNLASLKITFTPEELKSIGEAIPHNEVAGGRYADGSSHYRNDKNPPRI
eukprot:TRINITY_DN23413_c0_g1_i1.p1 TRINITY_DN23413_c0_g1~~TRINITY_DN23413_c0_g1_i1.p1  ORF type:complete len:345 (+),score=69.41 TRINITY_DN23413_c0_g1_i1:25-1035(+)